jgi:hypothetical protein
MLGRAVRDPRRLTADGARRDARQRADARHVSVGRVTDTHAASSRFSRLLGAAFALLRRRTVNGASGRTNVPHVGTGAAGMDSYEFAYFGRDLESLENAIATWCSQRKCRLETTELLEGATFRISGPDATIQEAMKMVRVWMQRSR